MTAVVTRTAGPASDTVPLGRFPVDAPDAADFGPNDVVIFRPAQKDLDRLPAPLADKARAAIEALRQGRARAMIEPKEREPLLGTYTLRVTDSLRVGFYLSGDKDDWHVYWIGEHNYAEAERRFWNSPGYRKFSRDYGGSVAPSPAKNHVANGGVGDVELPGQSRLFSASPGDPTTDLGFRRAAGLKGDLPEGISYRHEVRNWGDGGEPQHFLWATAPEAGTLYGVEHLLGWISWTNTTIDGAVVVPDFQRRGVASALLSRAREITPGLRHSDSLSEQGRAWSQKVASPYFMHDPDEPKVDTAPMAGFEQAASFDFITPQIATGGAIQRRSDLNILARRGVTGIVSGRSDFDDALLNDKPSLGIKTLWLATHDDGQHKPTSWFKDAIDFCLPRLRRGEGVYLHCKGGVNRGPSLAYAVLRAYTGMSHEKAMAAITSARPSAEVGYAKDADAALVELGYAKEPTAGIDSHERPVPWWRQAGLAEDTVDAWRRNNLVKHDGDPGHPATDHFGTPVRPKPLFVDGHEVTVEFEPHNGYGKVTAHVAGRKVGTLLWMDGAIDDVWVEPSFQRKGIASFLLANARWKEPGITHSTRLTEDGKAWSQKVGSTTTLYRGVGMDLREGGLLETMRKYLAMPLVEAEIGQKYKLGPIILDLLGGGYEDGYSTVGLGRHWTTRKDFADTAARTGGPYGNAQPVLITATWDGTGLDTEGTGVGGVETPTFKPWASEEEMTLLPGTPVTVTSVKIRSRQSWIEVLKEPMRALAGAKTAMPVGPPPGGIRYLITGNNYPRRQFDQTYCILGAFLGDRMVGYLTWGIQGRKVQSVWVDSEFRRRRIAETMFSLAKDVDPGIIHHSDRSDAGDAWVRHQSPEVPSRVNNTVEDEYDRNGGHNETIKGRLLSEDFRDADRILDITPGMSRAASLEGWRPTAGMFEPGRPTLDPRVFDLSTEAMRPEVRAGVLNDLDTIMKVKYPDWRDWTTVFLAGSGASYWWDSDTDFDILLGLDLDALVKSRPANAGLTEDEVCRTLTSFLIAARPLTAARWYAPDSGPWGTTYFYNPGSSDIRDIKPYAAYDLLKNVWIQHPPKLPADWSANSPPLAAMWPRAEQIAREAEEVLAIADPIDRAAAGAVFFDMIHVWRHLAYTPAGKGWLDFGNVLYQYLNLRPDHLLRRLYLCKHPEDAAPLAATAAVVEASTKDHVDMLADFRRKNTRPGSKNRYTSFDDLISAEGKSYSKVATEEQFAAKGFPRGPKGLCYENAAKAAFAHPELTYVEGYADMGVLPLRHAWCVDGQGTVYDPTWTNQGRDYFGVPMPTAWLMAQVTKSGVWGVFGGDLGKGYANATVLKDGIPKTGGALHTAAFTRPDGLMILEKPEGLIAIRPGTEPQGQITWTLEQDQDAFADEDEKWQNAKGDHNGYYLKIDSLVVYPQFRRQGVGTALLEEFIKLAEKHYGEKGWDPGKFTADGSAFWKAVRHEDVPVTQRITGLSALKPIPPGYTMEVDERTVTNPDVPWFGEPVLNVEITYGGRKVAGLGAFQRGNGTASVNIWVFREHQRKGLASAMYAEIHKRWPNVPIVHQEARSDDARALDPHLRAEFGEHLHLGSASSLSWDQVKARYSVYGGYGMADAINELAHIPDGEVVTSSLAYTVEQVPLRDIKFQRYPASDSRVKSVLIAYRRGEVVSPVMLVARAGELHTVDGHHRLSAEEMLGMATVPAVIAHSLRSDRYAGSVSLGYASRDRSRTAADDWQSSHRPSGPDDDYGAALFELDKAYPADVYTRPNLYANGEPGLPEAWATIQACRGKPDATVTIYRALPAQWAKEPLTSGNWVGISLAYAKGHATQEKAADDWPVMSYRVKAKDVWSPADSLQEYGYWGSPVTGTVVFAGGKNQRTAGANGNLPEGVVLTYVPHDDFDEVAATLDGVEIGHIAWSIGAEGAAKGRIGSVEVLPQYRRRGLASALLAKARTIEPAVHHSDSVTNDGAEWAIAVGSKTAAVVTWTETPQEPTGGSKWPTQGVLTRVVDGQPVAFVKFMMSGSGRKILIDLLESNVKRAGHASAVMDELQRRYPGVSIDHGERTDAGAAWWSGYADGKTVTRGRTLAHVGFASRVDFKPERPLTGSGAVPLASYLPRATFHDFEDAPWMASLDADIGTDVDDPDYLDKRARFFRAIPATTVSLSASLVVTQRNVNVARVEEIAQFPQRGGSEPIWLVRWRGSYWVLNGHHRLAADWARGEDDFAAKVWDAERMSAEALGIVPDGLSLEFESGPSDEITDPDMDGVFAYIGLKRIGQLGWYRDSGEISWVHVEPEYRRRGIAALLLGEARKHDPKVHHSDIQSADGRDWARAVASRRTANMGYYSNEWRQQMSLGKSHELNLTRTPAQLRTFAKKVLADANAIVSVKMNFTRGVGWSDAEVLGGEAVFNIDESPGYASQRTYWVVLHECAHVIAEVVRGMDRWDVDHGPGFRAVFQELLNANGASSAKIAAVVTRDYEGTVGDPSHITRSERGTVPTSVIADLLGARGETPGAHRNRHGKDWDDFVADVRANGVLEPIFITVDYGEAPRIAEGNHRRDAAVEAGLDEVPVEIRYFGHAERQTKVATFRASEVYTTETVVRAVAKKFDDPDTAGEFAAKILTDANFPQGNYVEVHSHPKGYGTSSIGWMMDTNPPTPVIALGGGMWDELTVIHECAHLIANGPSWAGRSMEEGTETHDGRWMSVYAALVARYGSPDMAKRFSRVFGKDAGAPGSRWASRLRQGAADPDGTLMLTDGTNTLEYAAVDGEPLILTGFEGEPDALLAELRAGHPGDIIVPGTVDLAGSSWWARAQHTAGANGGLPEGMRVEPYTEYGPPTGTVAVRAFCDEGLVATMTWWPETGQVQTIYVREQYRRRGAATWLFREVKATIEPRLHHAPMSHQTDDGEAWGRTTAGANGGLPANLRLVDRPGTDIGRHWVDAFIGSDPERIGWLSWVREPQPGSLWSPGEVCSVRVNEQWQRRGIASAMWDRARQIDPRVKHSTDLTDDGKAWSETVASQVNLEYAGAMSNRPDTVITVRKDRTDRGLSTEGERVVIRGPVHQVSAHNQTWCGRKMNGFASWNYHGSPTDVDCKKCLKAVAENRPRAWKR